MRRTLGIWAGALALSGAVASEPGDTFADCAICPEMTVVPAGSVTLGSYETEAFRRDRERPKQVVTIAEDFAMAAREVTRAQFQAFMEATSYAQKPAVRDGVTLEGCNYFDGKSYGYVANHSWESPGYPQREDEPVVCVSWSDADAYAKWLSKKTGREYRVPSSAEFEYALRAGADTPWPWGVNPDEACTYANIADRSFGNFYPSRPLFSCQDGYVLTTRVGLFEPNAFGLYDMIGNAWEWTNDCWHDDLTNAPRDGSSWEDEDGGNCEARTPKGGGWLSGPGWARAASRSFDGQHYRSFMLGFRVAASLEKTKE